MKSSEKSTQSGAAKRAPLKGIPAVELPDPRREDSAEQPAVSPRVEEPGFTDPPAGPKASDPPPIPPIDPEDAPPGLPKTMLKPDPKPKAPASPLNELFRNTPLPEPSPGQGVGEPAKASTAGMPLTIFRPSASVRSAKGKAGDLSAVPTANKPQVVKNESLQGRYQSGVFMSSDKLAKVSSAKKSDIESQWANPLRAGSAAGGKSSSGFVAKVFSPPARIERVAPGVNKINAGSSQGVEVLDRESEPKLAQVPSQSKSEAGPGEAAKPELADSKASLEGLSSQNPLRKNVRRDPDVKPVSYVAPRVSNGGNGLPERDNPLR